MAVREFRRDLLPAEIVDAHHHLWDLRAVPYPWLLAKGERRFFGDPAPIQRNYLPADFRADWGSAPIVGSVHIQVGAAAGAELTETQWLDAQAEASDLPSAIVAAADLTDPKLGEHLAAQLGASSRLRGVRQIVSRRADEDVRSGSPALLDDPAFLTGLKTLSMLGLSFDLQLTPPHLARAAVLFEKVPDLRVALCHVGSPWDQSPHGLLHWTDGLARFAALPCAVAKLSGFGMFDPRWTRDTVRPLIDAALDTFGPRRLMWGSNFPVEKLARSYTEALSDVAAVIPRENSDAIFAGTAREFYRLGLSGQACRCSFD